MEQLCNPFAFLVLRAPPVLDPSGRTRVSLFTLLKIGLDLLVGRDVDDDRTHRPGVVTVVNNRDQVIHELDEHVRVTRKTYGKLATQDRATGIHDLKYFRKKDRSCMREDRGQRFSRMGLNRQTVQVSQPLVDSEIAKLWALKDHQPSWNVVENLVEAREHVRGVVLIREDLREDPPHVIGELLSVDQAY